MRRRVKIVLWAGSFILLLTLFFAFALPAILRNVLEGQIEKNLHRHATVESVIFNPFTLSLSVQGLTVREPDSSEIFFTFERLLANAEIASAIKGGIVFSKVTLLKPRAHIVYTEANHYNFSDILATGGTPLEEPPEEKPENPFLFSIANIQIIDGFVEFDDRLQKVTHNITDIEIGLPLISNFKQNVEVFVRPSFSATLEGRTFRLNGKTKPFADTQETDFDLQLDNLDLAQYLPYVPVKLNFIMPSGNLSAKLKLSYIQNSDSSNEIRVKGDLNLADLELVSLNDSSLASIPSLAVSGMDCKLNKREFIIDEISLKNLSFALVREKGGTILLKQLFAASDDPGSEKPAKPETDADAGPAWSVLVKNLTSTAGSITFDDLLPPQPARFNIDNFDVKLANFTMIGDSPAAIDLSCRINNEGTLGLKGTFALAPPAANLTMEHTG